jgi:hypothetical protein
VQAISVLLRSDHTNELSAIEGSGKWELKKDPINKFIPVVSFNNRGELLFRC